MEDISKENNIIHIHNIQNTDSVENINSDNIQTKENNKEPLYHPSNADTSEMEIIEAKLNGRYHLIRCIGKGAQGRVFLAENTKTQQKVAIKQLQIQSVKDWKTYDLFQREAETLKRLDIQGVARLHEAIEILNSDTPMALIIQDYLEGDSLQTFISKGHRFRMEQIGEVLLELINILEKLHKSDPPIIHRDLKPSNIILKYEESSATPSVHIIDFGAVSNPQVKGGGSTVVGTYGYMAPEQLMGHAQAQSDIYSLAIIAVYLMSGVAPENLVIEDYRVLIDPHLEHLPHEITTFLRMMLEPTVNERMGDYGQIRDFFKAIKNQDYKAIPQVSNSHLPCKSNEYQFENVKSYRQPGNIELWQSLSDTTPRKLPKQLKELFRHTKQHHAFRAAYNLGFLVFINLAIVSIIIVIVQYLKSGMSENVVYCFIPVVVFIFLIFQLYIVSYQREYRTYLNSSIDFIKNSRKTLATIVRIEYCPAFDGINEYETENVNKLSTWNIVYSFNPPDDASSDPLVHNFKTHISPSTLKAGDLIPILYRIHDEKGEHVESMPFPIANGDEYETFYPARDQNNE